MAAGGGMAKVAEGTMVAAAAWAVAAAAPVGRPILVVAVVRCKAVVAGRNRF